MKESDALWAALSLLREDFERLQQAVGIKEILTDSEIAYWKAKTHAVEVLLTELHTFQGELPPSLREAVDAAMAVTAPACRPGDHQGKLRLARPA